VQVVKHAGSGTVMMRTGKTEKPSAAVVSCSIVMMQQYAGALSFSNLRHAL
jgi:hypothetical protein